jgi:hypothetical protein
MMPSTSKKFASTLIVTLALGAATTPSLDAGAAEPFGPVESRSFALKPGAAIEKAAADCAFNNDVLFVHGPNVAAMKSAEITPKVWANDHQPRIPSTVCPAPNCAQISLAISPSTPVGPRTVTLKHPDGRTATTTFDVVDNAGRCDKRRGGGGP